MDTEEISKMKLVFKKRDDSEVSEDCIAVFCKIKERKKKEKENQNFSNFLLLMLCFLDFTGSSQFGLGNFLVGFGVVCFLGGVLFVLFFAICHNNPSSS